MVAIKAWGIVAMAAAGFMVSRYLTVKYGPNVSMTKRIMRMAIIALLIVTLLKFILAMFGVYIDWL